MRAAIVLALLVAACSSRATTAPTTKPPAESADDAIARAVARYIDGHLAFRPTLGVDLGRHDFDGRAPDRSAAALRAEVDRLHAAERELGALVPRSWQRTVEREVVLAEIRKELFHIEVRRRPWRDPLFYLFGFSLDAYVAREFAPLEQRAAAMLRACEQAAEYYRQADANLERQLPKVWLEVGASIARGTAKYLGTDAKRPFASLADAGVKQRLDACLEQRAADATAFASALLARIPEATADFRLGRDNVLAMLEATEGLATTIETLERIARADLERNRAALVAAARQIDPTKDVASVVAMVSADTPDPDKVLAEATAQTTALKEFLVAKSLVSLPRPDEIRVVESPPFRRSNFASLGGVGPFERVPLPSFYYISPPDPAWPVAEQRAYVSSRADLWFTSAHEVYPGHFVQGMHQRASGSFAIAAFETYTASEGWAHYVEEMVWEQGFGNGAPELHVGQLKNALLRDVRFLVALGYHAGSMTIDEATQLFATAAYADPGNARQQAARGTVDPMFLGYTLGKLIIQELRDDWMTANPGKTLRDFHDEFLRYGEAPLPVTRRMMLGPTAKPPLADR